MQQRQPRLGDILDDYCPRERRLTNHVVVAMVGDTVKQTRCSTCDADHEYKHATLPRQRRKSEQTALYTQVLAAVTPKKMVPDPLPDPVAAVEEPAVAVESLEAEPVAAPDGDIAEFDELFDLPEDEVDGNREEPIEEGPAHRRLIRAQLPRHTVDRRAADGVRQGDRRHGVERTRDRPNAVAEQDYTGAGSKGRDLVNEVLEEVEEAALLEKPEHGGGFAAGHDEAVDEW